MPIIVGQAQGTRWRNRTLEAADFLSWAAWPPPAPYQATHRPCQRIESVDCDGDLPEAARWQAGRPPLPWQGERSSLGAYPRNVPGAARQVPRPYERCTKLESIVERPPRSAC